MDLTPLQSVLLSDTDRLSPGARRSLNWLANQGTHLKLPHTAMNPDSKADG